MALKPEYLQGLPDELAALTENLEAQLIGDIARRIAKAGEITDTAAYQIMRLKEMGASTEYIEKLLADYLKTSDKAIERMIFDAAQTDSEFYESVYARAGRAYVPFEHNAYLQQLAEAAVNQTKGELKNLTQSMGFAVRGANGQLTFLPAAKAYQSAMDKAHMLVASGGMDYITAVRMSVNDIAASGLRFVDYASGVRNHADVAARRAVLTGVSQMTGKISERNAAELGTDVVEVTAHAGARPDHAVWQGKWFSLKGKDKRYPKLSTATGYGTVTGLKGANCRHDFYPVIPGIDQPAYTAEQLANIDPPPVTVNGRTYTYYEAEQRQREMERAIRKTKREIIAAEASGDNDQFTAKSVLLRRQREQYSEFSKAAGLLTRNERTQVAEFGRSAGSKSSWAARKNTTFKINSNDIDFMSKSFKPRFGVERKFVAHSKDNITVDVNVKHVTNAGYKLYIPPDKTRRDQSIRRIQSIISNAIENLPLPIDIPPIVLTNFDKINSNAIAGYDPKAKAIFYNIYYDTVEKIEEFINKTPGYCANETVLGPILHELGHKFYYNSIKTLAKKRNMSYNDAKDLFDNAIKESIHNEGADNNIIDYVSEYAQRNFYKAKYTEVIAECYSVYGQNEFATRLLYKLLEMI